MAKSDAPVWLQEVQNKSWEPEILISGLTLTFLFVMSDQIYNFYAMLIQEFGVWEAIGKNLYRISLILLTGFKLILIVHLILRGIWTGLVGLSYTFPGGILKEKIGSQNVLIDDGKPVSMVIKLERICSILFSFIFTSVIFVLGVYILFVPISLLFVLGLDPGTIRFITLFIILPLVMIAAFIMMLFSKRFEHSAAYRKISTSIVNKTLLMYYTNIGFLKTNLLFITYFILILFLVFPQLSRFHFRNESQEPVQSSQRVIVLDDDNYEDTRDRRLRIPKATLDSFTLTGNDVRLFVSYFREDEYTLELFRSHPDTAAACLGFDSAAALTVPDLFTVKIDDSPVTDIRWFRIRKIAAGQSGYTGTLRIDTLTAGLHTLMIGKRYWGAGEDHPLMIDGWEIIPFMVDRDR